MSGLPKKDVDDRTDGADEQTTDAVALGGVEEAEVNGQRLDVLLLVLAVAVEPESGLADEHAEEEESLKADVVQVGGGGSALAHDDDDGSSQDEEEAEATHYLGPLDHGLLVLLAGEFTLHILLVEEGDEDEHRHADDEDVAGAELEGHVAEAELEDDAEGDDSDGRPDGSLAAGTLPQQTQAEDGDDARIDEARVFLDVLESLVEVAQQRLDGDGGDDEGAERGQTARAHQLLVGSVLLDVLLVDVHREEGRGTVEHGGQRTDDGSREGSEGQALDAGRREVAHQPGIGVVSHVDAALQVREGFGMDADVVGADAGENDDEGDEDLQETGEDKTLLRLLGALGSETLLDDILVEAPVAEVREPYATHHGCDAGHVGEGAGAVALLDDEVQVAVGEVLAGGEVGVEVAETRPDAVASTDGLQCEPSRYETAAHEEDDLHDVRPGHRGQTAVDGVDTCDEKEQQDDDHTHGDGGAADGDAHTLQTEDLLDGQGTQPGYGRQVDEDVEEQPEDGEGKTYAVVVALTQELRDGEDLPFQHGREEELADDDEGHGSHELVGGGGDTVSIARTAHADELFGADVGCDE